MAGTKKKALGQRIAEAHAMTIARDQAQQTPAPVRKAFLPKVRKVGALTLQPFTLGMLWLLEEIEHPFFAATAGAAEGASNDELPVREVARALFIFAHPERAAAALAEEVAVFDAEAKQLAFQIPAGQMAEAVRGMVEQLTEGLATLPGAGDPNPRQKKG